MRELYYYERDEHGHPRKTVCIMRDGKMFAIGKSYCCRKDQISKKKGRMIAKGRAKVALQAK